MQRESRISFLTANKTRAKDSKKIGTMLKRLFGQFLVFSPFLLKEILTLDVANIQMSVTYNT